MRDPKYTADLSHSLAEQLRLDAAAASGFATSPQPYRSIRTSGNMPSKTKGPKSKPRPIPGAPNSSLMAEYAATKASASSLAELQDLPSTATLLLLTPAVVPKGYQPHPDDEEADEKTPVPGSQTPAAKTAQTDPFESLGRTLATHHPRLRHVPYIPSAGLTATHSVFLSRADAVLVITAEPASGSQSEIDTNAAQQTEFVRRVAQALRDIDPEEASAKPMVNFDFGDGAWQDKQLDGYDHVFVGESYGDESIENVVQVVFGGRKRRT